MRIASIKTKNYKTLSEFEADIDKNYCAISGKNNSGKSALIGIITGLFSETSYSPWAYKRTPGIDYKEDKTQWIKENEIVQYEITIILTKKDDPMIISFIEKISNIQTKTDEVLLKIDHLCSASDKNEFKIRLDGANIDESSTKEIIQKLTQSNLVFLHNSTSNQQLSFYGPRRRSLYEVSLNDDEQKALIEANKKLKNKLQNVAKEHKNELNKLLGKLSEKYDVNFTTLEGARTSEIPFSISLSDKNVDVPIDDWGSGTQNRTHILVSILKAKRIGSSAEETDKATPVVIIEEPESFLHPSAQAEFGKILRALSKELGIQIIVTTHCPYMLNIEEVSANILLTRKVRRNKLYETIRVEVNKKDWMTPFAEQLGITNADFNQWENAFTTDRSLVLLVEGEIDKQYLENLRDRKLGTEQLDENIEIIPYGGKDALKNTKLLQFIVNKFDSVFITFDLDCKKEISRSLESIGLKETSDFTPIGLDGSGKDCIEGLLPQRVMSEVVKDNTDLVLQVSSTSSDRKKARDKLKKLYLDKFRNTDEITDEEVKEFVKIIKMVNKALHSDGNSATLHCRR